MRLSIAVIAFMFVATVRGEEANDRQIANAKDVKPSEPDTATPATKPRQKRTLTQCLQKERNGGYDEPDISVDEQFDNIVLRFSIYLELAKTEMEKDLIMECLEVVAKRVVDRVKDKAKQNRFK